MGNVKCPLSLFAILPLAASLSCVKSDFEAVCGDISCPVGMYAQDRRLLKGKEEGSRGQSVDKSGNAVVDYTKGDCAWTCVGDLSCPMGTWPVVTKDCFTCTTNAIDGGTVGGECIQLDSSGGTPDPRGEMYRGGCGMSSYAFYAFWSLTDHGTSWSGFLRHILLAETADGRSGLEDCEVVMAAEGTEYADSSSAFDVRLHIDARYDAFRSTCEGMALNWSGLLEVVADGEGGVRIDATEDDQWITYSYHGYEDGDGDGDGTYAVLIEGNCFTP